MYLFICKINTFYVILIILMIEELHRFIQVAKNGNLTKTAERLFITQSALTQSIQRLEKHLGYKLFIHKGKNLHLTGEGAALLELGTRITSLWDKAKNIYDKQPSRPHYTIGVFDNAAIKLGNYFQQQKQQNTADIELIIQRSSKLISQLQFGILDVAICIVDKKNPISHNLILVETFVEELIPVSSKIFKENIKHIPFILYNKDSFSRQYIDDQFIKKGISPNVFAESTSVTFMKELAILGGGIALLPENIVRSEIKQKILKKQKLPIGFQRTYGIYITKQGPIQNDHMLIKQLIQSLK